jgi:dipeptidyl aminopeptidase/acylaminoacyl peptidase
VNSLVTPYEEANMERKLVAFSCIALLILIDIPVQARELEDKIVFVSERWGTPEVFLVEGLDGRPLQLTRALFTSSPSISPDGTEVIFVSNPPAQAANILKLNIAKRRIEQLTHNVKQDIGYGSLDWSPDGQKILFIMVTDTPEDLKTDLCVMGRVCFPFRVSGKIDGVFAVSIHDINVLVPPKGDFSTVRRPSRSLASRVQRLIWGQIDEMFAVSIVHNINFPEPLKGNFSSIGRPSGVNMN